MFDLGKFLEISKLILKGKEVLISAIFIVILVFSPIDALEPHKIYKVFVSEEQNNESFETFQVLWNAIGVLAVAVIVLYVLSWFKDSEVGQWPRRWLEQNARKKSFKKLSEAQQLLVLNLYFGGRELDFGFDDTKDEIRELLNEKFVELGWISTNAGCSLQLTPSAREFIQRDKEQKKILRKELADKGFQRQICGWRLA